MLYEEALSLIRGLNTDIIKKVQTRLDNLTKPLGSLGRLEDIVKQLSGITGELFPKVEKKVVIIMCADNGVADEGISSCPKSITSAVTQNFMKGITGINILARHSGADITVVDIGVDDDINCNGILKRKIRKSTWNFTKGPAMTRNEAIKAIEIGIDTVAMLHKKGADLLGTGEMGIGNTCTSSAVAAVLTGEDIENMVGKGSGLTKDGLENKINIVKKAIALNNPDPCDPVDVLSKVGGFDIAGLTGCFIGAAIFRIPILIDGFISGTAALAAVKIHPEVKNFIFPSHDSAEPGHKKIMEAIGFEPLLNLDMRLGEGTGAALAFHIIDAAVAAYTEMGTFEDATIEKYIPLD